MKRKYSRLLLAAAMLLCACGKEAAEPVIQDTETAQNTETETEVAKEDETDLMAVWVKEPSMKLDSIANLEAVSFILGAEIELKGYPAEWYLNDPDGPWNIPEYRSDALIAEYQGNYGIMDYKGNVLYPFVFAGENRDDYIPIGFQPFEGFIAYSPSGTARKFSADFSDTGFILSGGVGGYAPTPYIVDHVILIDDPETMAVKEFTNTFHTRIAAEVDTKDRTPAGCAVVNENTEILFETQGHCGQFVNGFLGIHENSGWENPGRKGFVRVYDGKEITGGAVYEDALYFEDGYAPVKTSGRWAFIDEEGKPVSDPLFDGVSVLHNGRAYVKYHDLWGILDIAETLRKQIFISEETLGGPYMEETLIIPELHEEVIGTATILVDGLNSRSIPNTGGTKLEKVKKSETYDVYEIYEDSEYTWYRIGTDRWITDTGEWVSYAAG